MTNIHFQRFNPLQSYMHATILYCFIIHERKTKKNRLNNKIGIQNFACDRVWFALGRIFVVHVMQYKIIKLIKLMLEKMENDIVAGWWLMVARCMYVAFVRSHLHAISICRILGLKVDSAITDGKAYADCGYVIHRHTFLSILKPKILCWIKVLSLFVIIMRRNHKENVCLWLIE